MCNGKGKEHDKTKKDSAKIFDIFFYVHLNLNIEHMISSKLFNYSEENMIWMFPKNKMNNIAEPYILSETFKIFHL